MVCFKKIKIKIKTNKYGTPMTSLFAIANIIILYNTILTF